MKKKILIASGIILAAIIIIMLFTPMLRTFVWLSFFGGPPSPRSDVPLVYSLGPWGNQDYLSVTMLKAEVVESKLNLFNNRSLVRYSISGVLFNPKGNWKPYIKCIHANEKYLQFPSEHKSPIGEIILTPIVGLGKERYYGDSVRFQTKVEEIIESGNWGANKYIVNCLTLSDTIMLYQRK